MPQYVDGFVIPVPKAQLEAYRRMSRKAGKIWREFGVLEYRECVEDDVKMGKLTSFPRSVKLKDPRLASMMDPKKVHFDVKRLIYGGFKVSVDV